MPCPRRGTPRVPAGETGTATMRAKFFKFSPGFAWIIPAGFGASPAAAQVVIPYGNFGDGFEKYLVATITFVLLCFAAWRFFRSRG
jgi:hypothetical protein